jgi:hypothetical protein
MQPETKLDIEKLGSELLTCVQSLSDEIVRATSAIARNDLDALLKHIEFQQRLCTQLLAFDSSRHHLRASTAWGSIQNALRTLARNNSVYAALLVFSGRSHQILLTLCRAYGESSSQAADRRQTAPTLSCEV